MTAQPHPTLFDNTLAHNDQASLVLRPNVREHFWGYEVRSNEHVIGIAVLLRGGCGFLTVTSLLAAFGIWLVPAISFAGEAMVAKAFATVLLLGLAFVFGRMAARGTRVRVQVDTSAGEFREVVDGPLGKDIVLARYGFDAVEKIDVVTARQKEPFGQVQVTFKGSGKAARCIPVGDGGAMLLGPLRSRLASDCGLETIGSNLNVVWEGPLAA